MSDEDEDILSDDAFGSDDEKQYGEHFSNRQSGGEAYSEDSDEEDGDYVTIDDMLDEAETRERKEKAQKKTKNKRRRGDMVDDDDDDDDGIDDEQYERMAEAALGRPKRAARGDRAVLPDRTEFGAEDEYNVRSQSSVTAADLVDSLGASAQTEKLKQRVGKAGAALSQPMPAPAQQRVERSVAYEATSKEITDWQPTVKRNREADQLRFSRDSSHAGRRNVTTGSMQQNFSATSELETEIEAILKETGLEEDEVRKREDRELKQNMFTKEEVLQRQQELRQMRTLMFHQEKKAKRLKRIKSRSHRRLRKKDKEKEQELTAQETAELGGEAGEEARMKEERRRAQERMTQRHKNNSKWIKRQLALGKSAAGMSDSSRQAIAEQLKMGERLRRKVNDGAARSDSDDEDDDEKEARWLEQTRQELSSSAVGGNLWSDNAAGPPPEQTQKGLFAMKFMQKAAEKQQSNMRDLLAEMDEEAVPSEEEDSGGGARSGNSREDDGRGEGSDDELDNGVSDDEEEEEEPQENPRTASRRRKQAAAARADGRRTIGASSDDAEEDGGIRAADSERLNEATRNTRASKATRTQLSGSVAVAAADSSVVIPVPEFPDEASDTGASVTVRSSGAQAGEEAAVQPTKPKREQLLPSAPAAATVASAPEWETVEAGDGDSANPWLNQNGGGNKVRQKRRMGDSKSEAAAVLGLRHGAGRDGSGSTASKDGDSDDEGGNEGAGSTQTSSKPRGKQLSQQELLERAFVGGEQEADFEQAKAELVEKEDKRALEKDMPKELSGWGSWTGKGVKTSKRPSQFARDLEAKRKKLIAERKARSDDGLRHVLINEKKNKKAAVFEASSVPFGTIAAIACCALHVEPNQRGEGKEKEHLSLHVQAPLHCLLVWHDIVFESLISRCN
jgi:U3 small nucleolar RNA-associated protein 14